MRWKLKSNGEFTVQFCYETLWGSTPMPFPWKTIWRAKAPRKVSFFVWMAAWEKILILLIKKKKNFLSVSTSSREITQWWVDVVYAVVVGKLWTSSWYIAVLFLSCGVWYSWCLGFNGYYLRKFLIYYEDGGVGDLIQIYGILLLYIWCIQVVFCFKSYR